MIVPNEKDFVTWLTEEIERRGWNYSELARRVGVSSSNVHTFISRKRNPTWDFCAGVAHAFGLAEDEVFRKAGLISPLPPQIAKEKEAILILRQLSEHRLDCALEMLRGLARHQQLSQTEIPVGKATAEEERKE